MVLQNYLLGFMTYSSILKALNRILTGTFSRLIHFTAKIELKVHVVGDFSFYPNANLLFYGTVTKRNTFPTPYKHDILGR